MKKKFWTWKEPQLINMDHTNFLKNELVSNCSE